MQPLVLGVAALVVVGAVSGAVGLLLSPRGHRPTPSGALLTGVVLAFVGGFAGYALGPKGGGGAFLTGPAWVGAVAGAVVAVVVLLAPRLLAPRLQARRASRRG